MDDKGNLYWIENEREAHKRRLTPVKRDLTRTERRLMRIGPNSPCGCGSGIKFKKCCRGAAVTKEELT